MSSIVFLLAAAPALSGFAYAPHARMEFASPAEVRIDDAFWSPKYKVWRTVTLPDVLDKFEGRGRKDGVKDDWFANFDHVAAGERANGAHKGPHFANGLVYEAISGASDYLLSHRDPALAARLHAYAVRIAAAQGTEPDGYLNTHNQLCHPQFKWGENGGCLVTQHEIWNLGMLIEAGVRHWRATQDTTLLTCAVRAANLLCDTIGPSPRHNRVPTHTGPAQAYAGVAAWRAFDRLVKGYPLAGWGQRLSFAVGRAGARGPLYQPLMPGRLDGYCPDWALRMLLQNKPSAEAFYRAQKAWVAEFDRTADAFQPLSPDEADRIRLAGRLNVSIGAYVRARELYAAKDAAALRSLIEDEIANREEQLRISARIAPGSGVEAQLVEEDLTNMSLYLSDSDFPNVPPERFTLSPIGLPI